MVPLARLELARCCHQRILSPVCLPIPPQRRTLLHYDTLIPVASQGNRPFLSKKDRYPAWIAALVSGFHKAVFCFARKHPFIGISKDSDAETISILPDEENFIPDQPAQNQFLQRIHPPPLFLQRPSDRFYSGHWRNAPPAPWYPPEYSPQTAGC